MGELKENSVIRIGRSPVADFVIEHRGISQYHAELRLLSDGSGPPRLCIRDVSSNGTGMKRPGAEGATTQGATTLTKNADEAITDDAQLLFPMRLKENHGDRAWVTVNPHGLVEGTKPDGKADGAKVEKEKKTKKAKAAKNSPVAAKEDGSGSDQEADTEAARK